MAHLTDSWTDDPLVRADPRLRATLEDLAASAHAPVDPATRTTTLEAMLREASPAAPRHRRTRTRRVRRVLALTGVKVVLVGATAAAATTGGLAASGSLPAPAQQFVHEVGARVGIGFPAAPGQRARAGEGPAREHAPGQRARQDGTTTGRDHAPGQLGRPDRDAGVPPGHLVRPDDVLPPDAGS